MDKETRTPMDEYRFLASLLFPFLSFRLFVHACLFARRLFARVCCFVCPQLKGEHSSFFHCNHLQLFAP